MVTSTEIINIVTAYEDGKIIEWREAGTNNEWVSTIVPAWDFHRIEYRIKPGKPLVYYAVKHKESRRITNVYLHLREADRDLISKRYEIIKLVSDPEFTLG